MQKRLCDSFSAFSAKNLPQLVKTSASSAAVAVTGLGGNKGRISQSFGGQERDQVEVVTSSCLTNRINAKCHPNFDRAH